jgi:hypothetical protein
MFHFFAETRLTTNVHEHVCSRCGRHKSHADISTHVTPAGSAAAKLNHQLIEFKGADRWPRSFFIERTGS